MPTEAEFLALKSHVNELDKIAISLSQTEHRLSRTKFRSGASTAGPGCIAARYQIEAIKIYLGTDRGGTCRSQTGNRSCRTIY